MVKKLGLYEAGLPMVTVFNIFGGDGADLMVVCH